jgi:hypothetical protein
MMQFGKGLPARWFICLGALKSKIPSFAAERSQDEAPTEEQTLS